MKLITNAMPPKDTGVGLLSLALDGAALATLCIAWQVQHIVLTNSPYLIACAAVAITMCIGRLLGHCLSSSARSSSGSSQHVDVLCSAVEAIALATLVILVCVDEQNRSCFDGRTEDWTVACRVVVGSVLPLTTATPC